MKPSALLLLTKIDQHLSTIIPVKETKKYISQYPEKIECFISEIEIAIKTYNQFRLDRSFPHREFYINALELNSIYKKDLPHYSETMLTDSVFIELATDKYFQEVWQIRPLEYLLINLLILIYRTSILQNEKALLIDSNGHRLVQISSTIEEMVFALHLSNNKSDIYQALSCWLKDWQTEGFDKRLHHLMLK